MSVLTTWLTALWDIIELSAVLKGRGWGAKVRQLAGHYLSPGPAPAGMVSKQAGMSTLQALPRAVAACCGLSCASHGMQS